MASDIVKHFETLKTQLKDGKTVKYYNHAKLYEAECIFREPATQQQIDDFKKRTKWKLPKQYEELLLYSNGVVLFRDEYGAGFEISGLNEIELDHFDPMPSNWIPVVACVSIGDYIFFDSDQVESGSNYLMWHNHEHYYDEPTIRFTIDFATWLERLIITRGAWFWEWKN